MPRKRRPTPPLPGSIVRNLAPKPDPSKVHTDNSSDKTPILTSSSSRQSTAGSDIESSTCGVPQCSLSNCKLPTHLNYGRQRKLALLRTLRASNSRSPPDTSFQSSSQLSFKQNMDDKIVLPLEDTPNRDFQRLFQHFFHFHFDIMTLIFRPQMRDPAFKQTVYRLALHDPVYCLTVVAQAHMSNIKDNVTAPDAAEEHLTDTIYTHLLKMTREKVESFDLDDVDVLLMAIVVLCEYDLQLHQYDTLSAHHNGMKVLVSKRGGIHNLGLSLPYVLRMDRFLAVRSNQIPQFASAELVTSGVTMHSLDENRLYGSSFRVHNSPYSGPVKAVCCDTAHLLELMDDLSITFDPTQVSERLNPKTEYFYFLRENVEARYAVLNCQSQRSNANVNRDLLAVCATQLIAYYVAQDNYLPLVTDLLATRLWNILTKSSFNMSLSPSSSATTPPFERSSSDPSSVPKIDLADWKDNMPTLLWLLFACALPASRVTSMNFAGHLSSTKQSPTGSNKTQSTPSTSRTSPSPRSRSSRSILSPSSPRRHRYLPSFILYVAEHLVGERPLSGTHEWDTEVIDILETFIWPGNRLAVEYNEIMHRVHESVLMRAEE